MGIKKSSRLSDKPIRARNAFKLLFMFGNFFNVTLANVMFFTIHLAQNIILDHTMPSGVIFHILNEMITLR